MTDHGLIVRAVETAEPQVLNGDAMQMVRGMFPADSEPLRVLEELDTYAVAVLPLIGQEHPVGMLSVVNSRARGPFSEGDLDLLRDAAARAGLVLDRARLYRQQRDVAETLQRSLLHPPPDNERVTIAVAYVPAAEVAQVGGDWYDAFNQPDGAITLIIGDVMGHDLLAAAAMGETRMLMRTLSVQHVGAPARTLEAAEKVMHQLQSDIIATVLVGRLEPIDDGRITFSFSNAGHPPPILLHPDGRVDVLEADPVDPLIGVSQRSRSECTIDDDTRADAGALHRWAGGAPRPGDRRRHPSFDRDAGRTDQCRARAAAGRRPRTHAPGAAERTTSPCSSCARRVLAEKVR